MERLSIESSIHCLLCGVNRQQVIVSSYPMPLASTPIDYPCMITIESSLYILNPCDA
jgi:hypothetical protein